MKLGKGVANESNEKKRKRNAGTSKPTFISFVTFVGLSFLPEPGEGGAGEELGFCQLV